MPGGIETRKNCAKNPREGKSKISTEIGTECHKKLEVVSVEEDAELGRGIGIEGVGKG